MQRDAAKKLIQDTFEQPFDRDRFIAFTKNLLNHIEEAPFTYRGNYIFADFQDYVDTLERIGKYQDADGNKLDVLIVHLKRSTSLERARTSQRTFVAKYLKGSRGNELKDAALVAFVSPDEEDWRFSFVKMEYKIEATEKGRIKVREAFTPARRYSFLVGKNENSHTAQSKLLPILQNTERNPGITDLEEAFGIEKVTKEFFEQYRELFLRVKEALDATAKKDKDIRADFAAKSVETVDFAKKLLGQIVFLYFLQKKGWFGVKRKAAWGTGSKGFLRELFQGRHGRYENFFNDILEPLFYNTLAVERPENYSDRFDCRIPFLNGGLFDPLNDYDWVDTDILLPNALFSNDELTKQGDKGTGILDIFDRYNFTVKEDEPLEKEVAVDPEMLGKVFENLLEVRDRKSKGTYYTPREIVHYMCQESLIDYLSTATDLPIAREHSEMLIRHGEAAVENDALVSERGEERGRYRYKLPDTVRENAKVLDQRLADIKVCDPAVGSGAFLVGMMSEIVKGRMVLSEFLNGEEGRSAYELKRHAIQNSLYGVDIDPSATEIAKLRLWLSLIVDENDYRQIKPLPNLDYKIMQGNSLLESFEGIKLIDEHFFQKQDEKGALQGQLKQKQSQLQREYFVLHSAGKLTSAKKSEIEKTLKGIEKRLLEAERPQITGQSPLDMFGKTEAQAKAERLLQLHEAFFSAYNKRQKDDIRNQIDCLTWDLIEATLKQEGKVAKLNDVRQLQQTHTRPFFLWRLNYAEVFGERGGFDVVIANPPYVRQESIQELKPALLSEGYECYTGTADLLVYFYERGVKLLRNGGAFALITSNKFYRAGYGQKLREFLTRKLTLHRLIDFGDAPVFEAIAYASILEGVRSDSSVDNQVLSYTWDKSAGFGQIAQVVSQFGTSIPQQELRSDSWRLESSLSLHLLKKLRVSGKPLSEYVEGRIYRGIVTGLNEAFVIDGITRKKLIAEDKKSAHLIKPWLRGRDVKRWRAESDDLWLIFVPWHFPLQDDRTITGASTKAEKVFKERYPAIYAHLRQFKAELSGRNTAETGIRYEWYALQRWGAEHWQEFEQPKIVIPAITNNVEYAFDCDKHFSNDKTSICITSNPHFLLGLLNSKVLWWFIRQTAASRQGGFFEFKPMYVSALPIPQAQPAQKAKVEKLVKRIVDLKKQDGAVDVSAIEHEIDLVVFSLYELDPAEVDIISKVES